MAAAPSPINDSWIVATAIAHSIPIVTQDGDYSAMPDLEVMTVRYVAIIPLQEVATLWEARCRGSRRAGVVWPVESAWPRPTARP